MEVFFWKREKDSFNDVSIYCYKIWFFGYKGLKDVMCIEFFLGIYEIEMYIFWNVVFFRGRYFFEIGIDF